MLSPANAGPFNHRRVIGEISSDAGARRSTTRGDAVGECRAMQSMISAVGPLIGPPVRDMASAECTRFLLSVSFCVIFSALDHMKADVYKLQSSAHSHRPQLFPRRYDISQVAETIERYARTRWRARRPGLAVCVHMPPAGVILPCAPLWVMSGSRSSANVKANFVGHADRDGSCWIDWLSTSWCDVADCRGGRLFVRESDGRQRFVSSRVREYLQRYGGSHRDRRAVPQRPILPAVWGVYQSPDRR